MHRADTLRKAADLTTGDRNKSYGHPYDNMIAAAELMTVYTVNKYKGSGIDERHFQLTAEDVAHFMTIMKIVRTFSGKHHADNYVDAACYEAIAGECRFIEENDGEYPMEGNQISGQELSKK